MCLHCESIICKWCWQCSGVAPASWAIFSEWVSEWAMRRVSSQRLLAYPYEPCGCRACRDRGAIWLEEDWSSFSLYSHRVYLMDTHYVNKLTLLKEFRSDREMFFLFLSYGLSLFGILTLLHSTSTYGNKHCLKDIWMTIIQTEPCKRYL